MANVEQLHPELRARVQALIEASGGRVTIVSGYRSPEHQARLVEAAKKKHGASWRKWVAPPGKSNHNKGEAVDLGGDLALAHKLAPRFSLVFPMDHEAWHAQRAEFKSAKAAYTSPPAPGDARTEQSASVPLPPAAVSLAPDADRADLGVQLRTLLEVLYNPMGSTEGGLF